LLYLFQAELDLLYIIIKHTAASTVLGFCLFWSIFIFLAKLTTNFPTVNISFFQLVFCERKPAAASVAGRAHLFHSSYAGHHRGTGTVCIVYPHILTAGGPKEPFFYF
jgi:Fe2+ transport system protein B